MKTVVPIFLLLTAAVFLLASALLVVAVAAVVGRILRARRGMQHLRAVRAGMLPRELAAHDAAARDRARRERAENTLAAVLAENHDRRVEGERCRAIYQGALRG